MAGASGWEQLRDVVLPNIRGHVLTNTLMITLWTFNTFTPYLLTAGCPNGKTEILSFYIYRTLAVCGVPISSVRFPEGCSVVLMVRAGQPLAARGKTLFAEGDHVYLFCRDQDRPYLALLFGAHQG